MVRPGRIIPRGTDMTGDAPVVEQPVDAPAHEAGASKAEAKKAAKLDRLNKWLTLGANVGVVLGLVLVFVEVRQNAELTRTQMEQQMNDMLANIELSIAEPEMAAVWVKSVREPEALVDSEIRMLDAHLTSILLEWDYLIQMEAAGLVTRDRVRRHVANTAPAYFGSRFAKNWWQTQLSGWQGTIMEEVANPVISALDDTFIAASWDKMRIAPPAPPVVAGPAAVSP